MFAIVLMSTSCEEDEPAKADVVDDGLMTLAQLEGQWYVESYLFDDILWTIDSEIPYEYRNMDGIFGANLKYDTENMMATIIGVNSAITFTKEENIIKFLNPAGYTIDTYEIISYSGNEFKVIFKDVESDTGGFWYKGGVITFVR